MSVEESEKDCWSEKTSNWNNGIYVNDDKAKALNWIICQQQSDNDNQIVENKSK
jgi:hypothetical protein